MKLELMNFVGWVEEIMPPGDYDQKFSVANYRDKDALEQMRAAKEFPNVLMFSIGVRNGSNSQLDNVNVGDKVEVKFFLAGKSGVSKKNNSYYCVNNLNVAKNGGVTVIEKVKVDPAGQPSVEQIDDNDIPF